MRLAIFKTKPARLISLVLPLGLLTSCTPRERSQEAATESKAIELASAEFARTGKKLRDYSVTCERESTGRWIVWFDRKGPCAVPGGKHAVTVDKFTGKTTLMSGE